MPDNNRVISDIKEMLLNVTERYLFVYPSTDIKQIYILNIMSNSYKLKEQL